MQENGNDPICRECKAPLSKHENGQFCKPKKKAEAKPEPKAKGKGQGKGKKGGSGPASRKAGDKVCVFGEGKDCINLIFSTAITT